MSPHEKQHGREGRRKTKVGATWLNRRSRKTTVKAVKQGPQPCGSISHMYCRLYIRATIIFFKNLNNIVLLFHCIWSDVYIPFMT